MVWFYIFFLFLKRKNYIVIFFFFQAEDGIRDYKVTGVQTCSSDLPRAPAIARLPRGMAGISDAALGLPGGARQYRRLAGKGARPQGLNSYSPVSRTIWRQRTNS